jgi:uncharacterized protein YijF (DUF1287 family)
LVCGLALGLLAGPGSPAASDDSGSRLARAALARTRHQVIYDGSYRTIAYPNGDVPANIGVCTDLVIRSYRAVGVDLQRAVHEDMRRHFSAYPSRRIWGLSRPDPNIDHRRVPNLQVFLARRGEVLPVSDNPNDYRPGDLVTWRLPGNLPHIGIVSGRCLAGGRRPLIVHNIGTGPQLEDVLFRYPITGHYRYLPMVDSAETSGTAPTLPADRSRTEEPP